MGLFEFNYVTGAYFDVVLGGNPIGMSGQFQSVSGLNMEFEYETVMEGGSNYPRFFFKHAVPQTLVLEQGTVTTVDTFQAWMTAANLGMSTPLGGVVTLKSADGAIQRIWTISGAYVVRYIGPQLNSTQPSLAVTRIEIIYNGCT